MKWGAKYGPDYVNRLYAMVARHLARPFRLVCLTDDAAGLRGEVVSAPIPAMPRIAQPKERGWLKIASFSPALTGLLDEVVLFLDLDVAIMGSLDPFFDHPGAVPLIRDWYHPVRLVGNSSVYRYRPAERHAIFEHFSQNADAIVTRIRNEQEYLSEYLQARGELSFWPPDWAPSYRVGCLPLWPVRPMAETLSRRRARGSSSSMASLSRRPRSPARRGSGCRAIAPHPGSPSTGASSRRGFGLVWGKAGGSAPAANSLGKTGRRLP